MQRRYVPSKKINTHFWQRYICQVLVSDGTIHLCQISSIPISRELVHCDHRRFIPHTMQLPPLWFAATRVMGIASLNRKNRVIARESRSARGCFYARPTILKPRRVYRICTNKYSSAVLRMAWTFFSDDLVAGERAIHVIYGKSTLQNVETVSWREKENFRVCSRQK